MSLNYSSPLFLFGLLGIAVPVLIHLLTQRQQKNIQFSAVYLLAQSQKRSSRKSQPNRIFLLLARCLAIALFSLALADPFFSFKQSEAFLSTSPTSIVFILDDSYSMGVRADKKTLFEHVQKYISKEIKQAPDSSEFSLILASAPARIEQDWTSDKTVFDGTLKKLSVSFRTTTIGDAIEQSIQLLESAKQEKKKILFLTDLDKNGWREKTFLKISHLTAYPIRVVDFSSLQSEKM